MAVGLSDGTSYPDQSEWLADASKAISIRPVKDESSTASMMPLGGPTEPAGASNPSGGTQVPEKAPVPDYDYDKWKEANPGVEMAPGQHYPDTYKLPNHMTFSNESIYHNAENQGGQWGTDEQGRDTFTPGPANLQHHTMSELRDYFQRVEPNAVLNLPDISDVPHHDWVEGMVKGVIGAAQNAMGFIKAPEWAVDPTTGEVHTSPQAIEKASDLAGLMVFGPAPVANKLADGTLGSFAGVKSATADTKALQDAYKMSGEGAHPDEIWQKTGWMKGIDNKWKYEIDDSKSSFDRQWSVPNVEEEFKKAGIALDTSYGMGSLPNTYGLRKWKTEEKINPEDLPANLKDIWNNISLGKSIPKTSSLSDILDHPELYKAYPWTKNLQVKMDPNFSRRGAEYNNSNTITMGSEAAKDQGILMHEVQHAIQQEEGFAKGGAPGKPGVDFTLRLEQPMKDFRVWAKDTFAKVNEKFKAKGAMGPSDNDLRNIDYIGEVYKKYDEYQTAAVKQARENYLRLAGETESRNVETRLLMNQKERRAVPPTATQDIEDRFQIPTSKPALATAYGVRDPETGKIVKSMSELTEFRRAANENFAEGDPRRPYNIREPDMIGSKELDDALDRSWKTMADQHAKFIELYDKLHAQGEMMNRKGNWTELSVAKYNKLGKELSKHQGTEWTPVEFDPLK